MDQGWARRGGRAATTDCMNRIPGLLHQLHGLYLVEAHLGKLVSHPTAHLCGMLTHTNYTHTWQHVFAFPADHYSHGHF